MTGVQSKTLNYGETASVITTRSEGRRTLETGGWAAPGRMGNYRPGDHQHQPATPPPAFLLLPGMLADFSVDTRISIWKLWNTEKMYFFSRKLLNDNAKYGKVSKSDLYWVLRNASDHLARQTRRHGGQWYSCIIKNAVILSLDLISSLISCTVVLSLLPSQRLQSITYLCISGYM